MIAGEIAPGSEIIAPGNYRFSLYKGGKMLMTFVAAVSDSPDPVTLADVFASTQDPVTVAPEILRQGDSIRLLKLPGGDETTVVGFDENGDFTPVPKGEAATVPWDGVTDKPATFPPDPHDHDDLYYPQDDVDMFVAALDAAKSDTTHTHADATTSTAGFMSAADKTKLDGLSEEGGGGGTPDVAVFSHQEAPFSYGGASDGTVQRRVLNTTEKGQAWATLTDDVVTIDAGTYSFRYCWTLFANFGCGYLKDETNEVDLDVDPEHSAGDMRIARFWRDVPAVTFATETDIAIHAWRPDSGGDLAAWGNSLNCGPDNPPERFCVLYITKHA